ncbi:uncharacterized protein LOC120997169 isoform X2 [Bufo bufo]|uniref:uncharacterized protein LOC120997169 isoform X2 n=1 Tax=Bufo bufo TaxID=8384 RepID=UPI001ABDEA03|nr:uncharacterized protein LOC120997169 isoform X2 [Bufo bufo]
MAPSTDQTLHYIYGQDGAVAALVLILVNAVIASALLLGACAFCKIFKTKKFNIMNSREQRPKSELTKMTKQTEDKTQETNGTKNGAIVTGTGGESEEKGEGSTMSPRPRNGMVHGSVNNEHDTTPPNLPHRVLPPPPENLQAAPPASEEQDPLYDTVKDIKEVETRQASARSNEVPHPPSYQETTSPLPSHEADEKKDDGKTQVVDEPLYAVIHKGHSVKKTPPAQDPAGEKSTPLQNVNCDHQRMEVNVSMEQKTPEPSKIVDSMLSKCRKKSIKTAQLKIHDTAVNVGQEDPPAIPERHFDIESEFKEFTIEDTEVAGEPPAST